MHEHITPHDTHIYTTVGEEITTSISVQIEGKTTQNPLDSCADMNHINQLYLMESKKAVLDFDEFSVYLSTSRINTNMLNFSTETRAPHTLVNLNLCSLTTIPALSATLADVQ